MKRIILIALLTFISCLVYAEEKTGTTAFPFLKIGAGARTMGMAGAFVGLADEADAVYSNPAGLGFLDKTQISATHNSWFKDVDYESLSYVHPVKDRYTLGLSLNYLDLGEIKETTSQSPGGTGKEFKSDNLLAILSLAQKVRGETGLCWGANLKFIQERIDDEMAQGAAVDIGFLARITSNFRFGVSILNLGPKIKWEDEKFELPLNYKAGFSCTMQNTVFSLEAAIPYDNEAKFYFGLESYLSKALALRLGYKHDLADNKLDKSGEISTCWTGGLGFDLGNLRIDYAYAPYGYTDEAHLISLLFKFPQRKPKPAVPLKVAAKVTEKKAEIKEETKVEAEEVKKPLEKKEQLEIAAQIIPIEESGFLKIKVNIKNVSSNSLLTNLNYFTLITEDGQEHSYHSLETHLSEDRFLSGYLRSGEEREGVVVFKISSLPSALVYEDANQNKLVVNF